MFQKLYPTRSEKPVEEMHRLLVENRVRHERFKITLGTPPFERDVGERIVGIRLRFTPVGLSLLKAG